MGGRRSRLAMSTLHVRSIKISHCVPYQHRFSTSFHPLTNRKHHCRLCGRIICSLPPRPPTRVQPCSLLFVVDQRTGNIEEVGEGVDYGVKRRASTKGKGEEEDKFLKGVRICRDCRTVLLWVVADSYSWIRLMN